MNIYTSSPKSGVFLSAYKTDKFKSALMTVSFVVPLEEETASGYSLLTNLLSLSTGDYPNMQTFSIIKDELYALGFDAYVQRRGELLLVTLEINTISDSFTIDNEKILDKAIQLLGGAIFRPHIVDGRFPEENVESEKRGLVEEIASIIENKPSYALKQARKLLCKGEPFSVDAGGEIERVLALDGEKLMDYYYEILNNAPIFITYAGEADSEYLEECIEKHLPFTPRKRNIPSPVYHERLDKIIEVKETMEMEQSVLIMGYSTAMPKGPLDRAILSVYDEIFGGSASSKLFMNVREKEGLCYYCSSYPSGRKNVLFVSCGLEPEKENQAIDSINLQIAAMKQGDFTENELENAKKSILRSIHSVSSSLGSMNGYLLGQALLDDRVTVEENIALINSVTKEQVVDFAKSISHELTYILSSEA